MVGTVRNRTNNRLNALIREPAMLLDALETGLVLLVAFGIPLNHDQTTWIVALVVAVIALAKGISTQPFPVHLVTDLGRVALVLAASFGLNVSADKIALIVTFIGTLTTLVGSIRTTPRYSPVIAVGGAGAGPVSEEAGYAALSLIGYILVTVGVLLLVLSFLKVVAISLIICLVIVVIGIVLILLDFRSGNHRGTRAGY